MISSNKIKGVAIFDSFISKPNVLLDTLIKDTNWDESMNSRKTASFGEPYNYSQIEYPQCDMPILLEQLCDKIEKEVGFRPNNCLVNYYETGKNTMGWHSDRTDILEEGTGVIVASIGESRTLKFREITNKDNKVDFILNSGDMIYMTGYVQDEWQHSVPKSDSEKSRISLTFRKLV